MKHLIYLTYKSIQNRKITFVLSVISIAISVVLLLGVDKAIKVSKNNFINTINETDIIVASSNGSLDILLNLIFHISDPLQKMNYSSFEDLKQLQKVKWAVPLSLGDSFKGFDVISTNEDYFKYYRYASGKLLEFEKCKNLDGFFDVVLGNSVAKELRMKVGDTIHLSHGKHKHHHTHENREFKIVGILEKSMTPNDESVFMQLKADEAIHIEWQTGHFVDMHISSEKLSRMNIKPKYIGGVLLGLNNRSTVLEMQDKINNYKDENLKAVIPAKALSKLYKLMKNLQDILMIISGAVFIAAIFTMLSSMFSTLNERRREVAIFRSLGASSWNIFALFAIESFLIIISGILIGVIFLDLSLLFISFYVPIEIYFGLDLYELFMLLTMLILGLLASMLPAEKSYKNSLQDGLTVKI
ncbi:MAG: ABC transporter permease [Sulfurimonas sp.]|jgi:putative ABC transport system permease protein|nr:ABC transporter permease [Sulfurimonas sp.]